MDETRKQHLAEFVAWARKHISGDEKGEAQIFLDRLFQAFGQGGIKEAGATLEMRVRQADNKGTAFADLVWKPIVLIEMKKRGEDLLAQLLELNLQVAARIEQGQPVTAPGVPPGCPTPAALLTADCIRPDEA